MLPLNLNPEVDFRLHGRHLEKINITSQLWYRKTANINVNAVLYVSWTN